MRSSKRARLASIATGPLLAGERSHAPERVDGALFSWAVRPGRLSLLQPDPFRHRTRCRNRLEAIFRGRPAPPPLEACRAGPTTACGNPNDAGHDAVAPGCGPRTGMGVDDRVPPAHRPSLRQPEISPACSQHMVRRGPCPTASRFLPEWSSCWSSRRDRVRVHRTSEPWRRVWPRRSCCPGRRCQTTGTW
jgi:hypothetical protein